MKKIYFVALLSLYCLDLSAQTPFITTWKTDNPGSSADNQITIPTYPDETYNYNVDWGDGTSDLNVSGNITHTYAAPGTYQVSITGQFPQIYFGGLDEGEKIISIDQWGDNQWQSMFSAFWYCENLDVLATDIPDLSQVESLVNMFTGCSALIGNSSFGLWNVANVTDMSSTFNGASLFNIDISSWDVGNVTAMPAMFSGSAFNQDISGWNVSNVENMLGMFSSTLDFNIDISNWDVGKVTDMSFMFSFATGYNQPLNLWDVSNVTNMEAMFRNTNFNQPLNEWNVSNVTNMSSMFEGAMDFDQDLGDWNVSQVTTMEDMFNNNSLSTDNYDSTLIGWYQLPSLQSNVSFDGGGSQYCTSVVERLRLVYDKNWVITDQGKTTAGTCAQRPFITTWKTDNPGGSDDNQISIPTFPGETYDYTVDWGDGTSDTNVTGDITHTYSSPGTYKVEISGDFPRIYFFGSSWTDDTLLDNKKLITIQQWGFLEWTSMEFAFLNCTEMEVTALDVPLLTGVTNLNSMFNGCYAMQGTPSFAAWNVGSITEMNNLFADSFAFEQDIGNWNVSNVTDMSFLFSSAQNFNGDISSWNVSNVTNMRAMFQGAAAFNQDIGGWNVGNANDMLNMFFGASAFNQDIGGWNVGNVNTMNAMFSGASAFNQDIGNWNVSLVTDMEFMFFEAESFDQNLGNWNIEVVSNLSNMFNGATLSTANYDSTLEGWSNQTVNNGLTFDGGNSLYCNSLGERQNLINAFGWTIADGGLDPACAFVTTWKTDNPGTSNNNQITIPTFAGEIYDYIVDWGDGTSDTNVTGDITHTYTDSGTYQVAIYGDFPRIHFNGGFLGEGDSQKIMTIEQWGLQKWRSMEEAFEGCFNLDVKAIDLPDFTNLTRLKSMFRYCTSLQGNELIGEWDVSMVTDISFLFERAEPFNQDIGNWNVSNVSTMVGTFLGASSFNQDISDWQVDNVTVMNGMFNGATSFNQDIGNWNVGNVEQMGTMFADAAAFNQNIANWDVSNVTYFEAMFFNAVSFNQDISGWDLDSATNLASMFAGASVFNQDISIWNLSNVTDINSMFFRTDVFNQNIGSWDVSNVTNMIGVFSDAKAFNQDIGSWDVSNVTNMEVMFQGASSFDHDLKGWDVQNVTDMREIFSNTGLSLENYDKTLISWSQLANLQTNVVFGAGNIQYCEAADARQLIIDSYGWTITDAGEFEFCNEDNDGDGVLDHKDSCLDTQAGVPVNANGCDRISNDAVQVYVLTPSCVGSDDGTIEISMNVAGYLLDISIEGDGLLDQFDNVPSESGLKISGLPVGTYTVIVSIPEILFEQRYGLTVNELDSVSGKREVLDSEKRTVSYTVLGSNIYEVMVNDEKTVFAFEDTGRHTLTLENLVGQTEVTISGENDCQGKIFDTFFVGNGIEVFPTITYSSITLLTPGDRLMARIYNLEGRLVSQTEYSEHENSLDISALESGVYLLQMSTNDGTQTIKIVKR